MNAPENSLLKTFKQEGFVIVPNVLTSDDVSSLRTLMAGIFRTKVEANQGDLEKVRSNVFNRFPALQSYFFRPEIIKPLKQILGENFFIMPEVSVMESQYGGWHKDTTSIEIFGEDFHKGDDFIMVNAAIYLQNNEEFGGGLDVVPGSHKGTDPYVQNFKDYKSDAKKVSALKKIKKSVWKIMDGYFPSFRKLIGKEQKVTYPLSQNDLKQGRYTIPSKAGDLVIFDLRLDHKASWPISLSGIDQSSTKYAFFVICGANNNASLKYKNYLFERAKKQTAYNYLKSYEVPRELSDKASQFGASVL